MASSPSNNSPSRASLQTDSKPNSIPNTTFVHANPSTFRAVVQRLTGKPNSGDAVVAPRRGPTARNLQIKLNKNNNGGAPSLHSPSYFPARDQRSTGTTAALIGDINYHCKVVASPVSQLEYAAARGSPGTPPGKGFYLNPNLLSSNPRGSDPPELLPLFPLHSYDDDSTVS